MTARHARPIAGRREHHVDNVVPIRPAADVNPAHPSATPRPAMYDQATDRAGGVVLLTELQAQAIAGLLRCAKGHLPSPRAAEEAIELLRGVR